MARQACMGGSAQVQECMVTNRLCGEIKDVGLVYRY